MSLKKSIVNYIIVLCCLYPVNILAQDTFNLSGKVFGPDKQLLPGAAIILLPDNKGTVTDDSGNFFIEGISKGQYILEVSFLGFRNHAETIVLETDLFLTIQLMVQLQTLQEVVIKDNYALQRNREESLHVEVVNETFIKQNLGGSLMQSLERLPGISTLEIGSGQSKPVIRGLSFNRVVVVENGIKHEGQQWGADHGLEVDQFAYNRMEVIKGPSALLYGSDAIGGVINLAQTEVPQNDTRGGSVSLIGDSNNNLGGTSVEAYARRKNYYLKVRGTIMDYSDFKVPTDSIDIYSYKAAITNNRLRNTAGGERNLHAIIGYLNNGTSGKLIFSNVQNKQGFFANTHGLEPRRVNNVLHDKSHRDINMPYQKVNHLKLSGIGSMHRDLYKVNMELGYQKNLRKEWSQYTRHGYMPTALPVYLDFPEELERQFDKSTWSGNLSANIYPIEKIDLLAGITADYQVNAINGRGFILPEYEQLSSGLFLISKYSVSARNLLLAGIRLDYGNLNSHPYHDWFSTPIESEAGKVDSMLQRAPALSKSFTNISWSLGYIHNGDHVTYKINAGKSFRMPTAKELAANGVNYHRFSYEKGNPDLSPETAFQLDAAVEFHDKMFAVGITPFLNYFPNYIYLNPGFEHDRLYGNGNQIFNYTQSKVFRWGGELHSHYSIIPQLKAGVIVNYIWSTQLSGSKKGYTLPFSPPASALIHLKYAPQHKGLSNDPYLVLDINIVGPQNNIVPPEVKTPGYTVVNIAAGTDFNIANHKTTINLQLQNLLNRIYHNHTSYYRLINVPGPARSVSIGIHILF